MSAEGAIQALLARAEKEPLGIDLSDYSDEYVAAFLSGQWQALAVLAFPQTYAYADIPEGLHLTTATEVGEIIGRLEQLQTSVDQIPTADY